MNMNMLIEAFFTVNKGLNEKLDLPIHKSVVNAGSSETADLKLGSKYVSRRHFQVRLDGDVFYISDLGSTNGTYLNGAKLDPYVERVLRNGAVVEIGPHLIELVFSEPVNTVHITHDVKSTEVKKESDVLVVNAGSRDVWVRGEKLDPPLTYREFEILHYLFSNRGLAIARDAIASAGWPERSDDVSNDEIDQNIKRIRTKIEVEPSKPLLILTRRGYGYMMPSI